MFFPKSTEFNRKIAKQKFYENLNISPSLKRAFVEQIQSVYWSNKLSPSTTNLEAGSTVPEIEVFRIILTSKEFDEAVLLQIDQQIPYHVLFILSHEEQIKLAIAHKHATSSKNTAFKVNRYFFTPWQDPDDISLPLVGLNLDVVWENLITQIGHIQIKDHNTLDQQIAADEKRAKLEKEIARLEKLARAEKQPKKKFELVQRINQLSSETGVC